MAKLKCGEIRLVWQHVEIVKTPHAEKNVKSTTGMNNLFLICLIFAINKFTMMFCTIMFKIISFHIFITANNILPLILTLAAAWPRTRLAWNLANDTQVPDMARLWHIHVHSAVLVIWLVCHHDDDGGDVCGLVFF